MSKFTRLSRKFFNKTITPIAKKAINQGTSYIGAKAKEYGKQIVSDGKQFAQKTLTDAQNKLSDPSTFEALGEFAG